MKERERERWGGGRRKKLIEGGERQEREGEGEREREKERERERKSEGGKEGGRERERDVVSECRTPFVGSQKGTTNIHICI